MTLCRKVYILLNGILYSFLIVLMIMIYLNTIKNPDSLLHINKLMNEWSQGPILSIKTIKFNPKDYRNSNYYF